LKCEICGAPPLPLDGACVFCRSPLAADPDPDGLLDYLASRLPEARASRGLLGRASLREVELKAGGIRYGAALRAGRLRLRPESAPAEWVDHLLGDLSREAESNPRLRTAVTRAGWALR
jgi:hypothetical protein